MSLEEQINQLNYFKSQLPNLVSLNTKTNEFYLDDEMVLIVSSELNKLLSFRITQLLNIKY